MYCRANAVVFRSGRHSGFTLVELLVVIAIIGVLAGLLLPAIQNAREAGRRMSCGNNIRQLAIAAHGFETSYRRLPAGVHPNISVSPTYANPKASGPSIVQTSGLTQLLPFLEQGVMYNRYDLKRDWFDPANEPIVSNRLPTSTCPSSITPNRQDGAPQAITTTYPASASAGVAPAAGTWIEAFAITDYSSILGVNPLLGPSTAMTGAMNLVDSTGPGALSQIGPAARDADIMDGKSNTILYAECAGRPNVYRKNRQFGSSTQTNRVYGGAWANPASDFWLDGSFARINGAGNFDIFFFDAAVPPTCALNCTNGEDIDAASYPYSALKTASLTIPSSGYITPTRRGTHSVPGLVGTGEPYSFHIGGANFVFGDASVKFVSQNIDIREFARFVTRDAGEIANLPD